MCKCFSRDLTPQDIACYVVQDDGALWALYRPCPAHGCSAVSVVYSPTFDLRQRETATVDAVAVQ